jgi:hypothetical protein
MLTVEEREQLNKFIPESEMVKLTFSNMHPEIDIHQEDFKHLIINFAEKALQGDKKSLITLLELTAINSYNEGMLDEFASTEGLD